MNTFEKKLQNEIIKATNGELSSFSPSLEIQVLYKGKLKGHLKCGDDYKYYDWASLTKIVFATSASIRLYDLGMLNLNQSVSEILPWWPHQRTTLKELLTHSSGLHWWRPYYKKVAPISDLDHKRQKLQSLLQKEALSRSKKAKYSDLGMLLFGFVLEELSGCSLEELWSEVQQRVGLRSTNFHVGNRPPKKRSLYAPTEKCPWRKKILRGEVHDQNTWALGGVSTHAGLFGPMGDLQKWAMELRRAHINSRGSALGSQKSIKHFTRRAIPKTQGDWGLGFMKPTQGRASCGKYFAPSSAGHTGFTGTSLWFDPRKDLAVLILGNRVHPTSKNTKFAGLRPKIHDIICKIL